MASKCNVCSVLGYFSLFPSLPVFIVHFVDCFMVVN